MRLRSVFVLIGLLAAPLAACGDDDDSADLGPYIDAVAASFAETEEDSPPVSEEQAQCAAEKAVNAIDEDVITSYDTPEDLVAATEDDLSALDLDDETLDTIAEDIVDCLGGMEWFSDQLASFGLTAEQIACVDESITEDDFVASIRADIAGEEAPEFDSKIGACVG